MPDDILIDRVLLKKFLLHREAVSHKGDYGHLLLVCGCDAMPGAAVLSVASALKSGCGLVTLHTSRFAAGVCAVANPSAMLSIDEAPCFSSREIDLSRYNAVAAGPGLGRDARTADALESLVGSAARAGIPMILDADALNVLSVRRHLLDGSHITPGSVLTPHDGELQRLAGRPLDGDKLAVARGIADRTGCIVVSKGHPTTVCVPGHDWGYRNTTGNAGLAKGGSGDVLTGLLSGLVSRGYGTLEASLLAVWLHGYAGDRLTGQCSAEAYNSRDLVECLRLGFAELYSDNPHQFI